MFHVVTADMVLLLYLINLNFLNVDEEYEGDSDRPKKAMKQRLAS